MKRFALLFLAAGLLLTGTACSSPFVTNTARSAVEQMLLSTVIERGVSKAEFSRYKGKTAQMDYTNLAPQVDKDFLISYTELHLANNGVIIAKTPDQKPDIVIQVGCGILATDIDKIMIGTPALPLPVPDTTLSIVIPEIPLFRRISRTGHGRFFFTIIDAKTRRPLETFAGLNAQSQYINWTVLLVPFKTHNIPANDEARVSNEFLFPYEE